MNFALAKYFTAEKILSSQNITLQRDTLAAIERLCEKHNLKQRDIETICQLIAFRKVVNYEKSENFNDEIEKLNEFFNKDLPITKIKIESNIKGGDCQITDSTLINNFLLRFEPFYKYIQTQRIPREKRKISGDFQGLQRFNRRLAVQIIKYHREETSLRQKEIIDIIVNLFSLMDNPLMDKKGKPCVPNKNFYDTLTQKKARRKT